MSGQFELGFHSVSHRASNWSFSIRKRVSFKDINEIDSVMKSQSLFRAHMSIEPAVVFEKPRKIVMASYTFEISNITHPKTKSPMGLSIVMTLEASNIVQASKLARGYTNLLVSLISHLSAAGLPQIRINKIYDVTPGKERGKFIQNHYTAPLKNWSIQSFNDKDLRLGITSINKFDDKDINRILRSMHWYRLALKSQDVLERFTSLWIGLETINPLLREHFGLDIEYRECKCGHKLHQTLNGFMYLIQEISNDDVKWGQLRGLRSGTLHGYQALENIVSDLQEQVPFLAKTLGIGLNLLLGFEGRWNAEPVNLAKSIPAFYTSTALITGPDLQELDTEFEPSIIFQLEVQAYQPVIHPHIIEPILRIDRRFSFEDVILSINCNRRIVDKVYFSISEGEKHDN